MVQLVHRNVPYVGPGADNYPGLKVPGGLSILEQIRAYAGSAAGTTPPPGYPAETQVGLMNLEAGIGSSINVLYSTLINLSTVCLLDLNQPQCNPLLEISPGTVPPATGFADLVTYVQSGLAQLQAVTYPNSATVSTAEPIDTAQSSISPYPMGILFNDTSTGAVSQCLNLYPSDSYASPPTLYDPTAPFIWAIAFETPATLSSGTDASLFTVGAALDDTLQIAFVVKDGHFGAYIGGTNYIDSGQAPIANTRYSMVVTYQIDPYNPLNFQATLTLSVSGAGQYQVTESFPYAPNLTPWSGSSTPESTFPGSNSKPIGFGPQAAFGGQWAFLALGYYAAQLGNIGVDLNWGNSGHINTSMIPELIVDINNHFNNSRGSTPI